MAENNTPAPDRLDTIEGRLRDASRSHQVPEAQLARLIGRTRGRANSDTHHPATARSEAVTPHLAD